MQKLVSELIRLYLAPGTLSSEALAQRLLGTTGAIDLATADGLTRAICIPFHKIANGDEAQHWSLLCTMANALQGELGLPAPAVSISGADGYGLWLSLEVPIPTLLVRQFQRLLWKAYCPGVEPNFDASAEGIELPPCLHWNTGKWTAFINPGLGASFADESGLEMAPPFAGQAALLEDLESISASEFLRAMNTLRQAHGETPLASAPAPARASTADGLLLQDATLEDIVRYLHSKNIEPTFRHLIQGR